MAADTTDTIERRAPGAPYAVLRSLAAWPAGEAGARTPFPATLRFDLMTVCTVLFGAVAVGACALAFVDFGESNYWTDELFTLFVVDHHGGVTEVLRRALTDTHPPAYYILLYGWKSLFGLSETSTRLLSALCAVSAVGIFVAACRDSFSRPAIAFAAAVGATSSFWFFQAQNARNYSLCLLLVAAMLAGAVRLRREALAGRTGWLTAAGIVATGAVGAFTHFYALLTCGFVFAWLILTVRDWRLRGLFVVAGLAILGASLVYVKALSAHTQQAMGEMWFRNDTAHLLGVIREVIRSGIAPNVQYGVLLLLLIVLFAPRKASRSETEALAERRWLTGFGATVIVGVYLTGVAISVLVTPSLSDQNVLVASPLLWLLWAALFDRAWFLLTPRGRPWACAFLACLLATEVVVQISGRLAPRNEQWRDSADYIASLPACAGAEIPVVRPFKFGPDTAFFRDITSNGFFGRFLPGARLIVRSPEAFLTADADPRFVRMLGARANSPSACPVLAWAVHDVGLGDAQAIQRAMTRLPGMDPAFVQLRTFSHFKRDSLHWEERPSSYVFVALRPGESAP